MTKLQSKYHWYVPNHLKLASINKSIQIMTPEIQVGHDTIVNVHKSLDHTTDTSKMQPNLKKENTLNNKDAVQEETIEEIKEVGEAVTTDVVVEETSMEKIEVVTIEEPAKVESLPEEIPTSAVVKEAVKDEYFCQMCKEGFLKKKLLNKHFKNHYKGENFENNNDGKMAKQSSVAKEKKEVKQKACEYCDEIFFEHPLYELHKESYHWKRKECEYCDEIFLEHPLYELHKETHHWIISSSFHCWDNFHVGNAINLMWNQNKVKYKKNVAKRHNQSVHNQDSKIAEESDSKCESKNDSKSDSKNDSNNDLKNDSKMDSENVAKNESKIDIINQTNVIGPVEEKKGKEKNKFWTILHLNKDKNNYIKYNLKDQTDVRRYLGILYRYGKKVLFQHGGNVFLEQIKILKNYY